MPDLITMDDVRASHTKERMHGHGTDFFFYIHQCNEFPRLSRFDRYDRKTRSVTSTWRVDGQDVANLEAAIAALNVPPVLTDDEAEALKLIPDDFADIRKTVDHGLRIRLDNKGFIEWGERGQCRRRREVA